MNVNKKEDTFFDNNNIKTIIIVFSVWAFSRHPQIKYKSQN
jgi:hypothetical protein